MSTGAFRSKEYPESQNRFMVLQQFAQNYYATFGIVIILGCVLMIFSGKLYLWSTIFATLIMMSFANILADVKVKSAYAEIFFVQDNFYLLTIDEVLGGKRKGSFPLSYASAYRTEDSITIHYHDLVVHLDRKNWPDLDVIWEWFQPPTQNFQYHFIPENSEDE